MSEILATSPDGQARLAYPEVGGPRRAPWELPDHELEAALLAQLTGASHAGPLTAAVCTGALATDVAEEPRTAQVVARAVYKFDPTLRLGCSPGPGRQVIRDCGITVACLPG